MDAAQIEEYMSKVGSLLELIQNNKLPNTEMPPELIEQLNKVVEGINNIKKINSEIFNLIDIDKNELYIATMQSDDVSDKKKRLLKRGREMEQDTTSLIKSLKSVENSIDSEKNKSKKDQTRESKNRQKKFKAIGGNKGWIPL